MRILFIGDVVGRPGRSVVHRWLPRLREEHGIDIVVANAENAAGGVGATPDTIGELFDAGVQAITLGNHTWRKKELLSAIDKLDGVVRPANYPDGVPGKGSVVALSSDGRKVGIVNVLGRVFLDALDCPFLAARREIELLRAETSIILVDMHAEATSEKMAMGRYLDGSCTAVVGTHTHVTTADEQILPHGTAYITDVGMSGPMDSILGVEKDAVIKKFLTGVPTRFTVAHGEPELNAVLIEADEDTGKARTIERVNRSGA